MKLDHIAVLVTNIEETARAWSLPDQGVIEEFPDEGTRELYCGPDGASGRLLLMQPIGPGPYQRAMQKRGPGLHHVALCVEDVASYVAELAGSGWLLHPASLELFTAGRQAWLCRPGFPLLVELTEAPADYAGIFVERLDLAVPEACDPMLAALRAEELRRAADTRHAIVLGGGVIPLVLPGA